MTLQSIRSLRAGLPGEQLLWQTCKEYTVKPYIPCLDQVQGLAVVTPILIMHGPESWVPYRRQVKLLERFHQRCLRTIFNVKWQECDIIPSCAVLQRPGIYNIESIPLQRQLRWSGHAPVCQMPASQSSLLASTTKTRRNGHLACIDPHSCFQDRTGGELLLIKLPVTSKLMQGGP